MRIATWALATALFLSLIIYFDKERETDRDRETERVVQVGRGRERGRKRTPSRLSAVSAEPDAGIELMNRELMT